MSAAGQTLREFLCPSHPCGRETAVGNTEHFAHAMDLSMGGSALEMKQNCSMRGVPAKQCKYFSVQLYDVQQVKKLRRMFLLIFLVHTFCQTLKLVTCIKI